MSNTSFLKIKTCKMRFLTSNRPKVFCKKIAFKNFSKFTGKQA